MYKVLKKVDCAQITQEGTPKVYQNCFKIQINKYFFSSEISTNLKEFVENFKDEN